MNRFNHITKLILAGSVIVFIAFGSVKASNVDLSFAPVPDKDAAGTTTSFVLQPDDKVLVFGNFPILNGEFVNRIVRLHPDGSRDSTFYCTACDFDIASALVQPDGKILIGGGAGNVPRVQRLNSDGSIDSTFAASLPIEFGSNATVEVRGVHPDGKILVLLKTLRTTCCGFKHTLIA